MTNSNIDNFIDKTWVVAVSGGADSMALLNMAYELKLNISVAHVNYKKRITADRDMDGVMSYCKLRDIPCYVHIVSEHAEGNFQEFARDLRYNFFKEIVAKTRAHGVLVAHHLDDLIETYMIQKERNGIVKYYGIKEEAIIKKVLVKRILLSYTKEELENYCNEKNITYYNDESNYSRTYTRNRIRID
ncbi:MAG: tRNA lysidine(34) synthetase TilS, partial [Erysipelotrichaceae bacterium]